MSTVGEILKNSREAQGLTLEQVSAATHIKIRFLQMLEENDLGTMPEESYFLGFISSYASFLGLSSADLCHQFLKHFKEARKPPKAPKKPELLVTPSPQAPADTSLKTPPPSPPPTPEPAPAAKVKAEPETKPREEPPSSTSDQPSEPSRQLSFYFWGTIILLAVLFFSYSALKKVFFKAEQPPPPSPPVVQAPAPPAPQPSVAPSPPPPHLPPPSPRPPAAKAPPPTPTSPAPPAAPKAEPSKVEATKAEPPSKTPPAVAAPLPAAPSGAPLRLEARALQDCWIGLRIDSAPQRVEFTLKQGQRASWGAKEQFLISVGNAGGVELLLNGVSLGKLGEAGQVRTDIYITKEGRR